MKILYLFILHAANFLWFLLWLAFVFAHQLSISAGPPPPLDPLGIVFNVALFILWGGSYYFQIRGKSWKTLLIGNAITFIGAYIILDYILPWAANNF